MHIRISTALLASLLSWAGGTGASPVPGSSRPDVYARAGQELRLNVPEIRGRTVKVGGLPATIQESSVTVRLPEGTTPGRHTLNFVDAAGRRLTSRDVEVLPVSAAQAVDPGRVQLLVNPRLGAAEVDRLLGSAAVRALGTVGSREVLPAAQGPGSPCGGTLAELTLKSGVSVEAALNALLQLGSDALWYPDPIGTYGSPNQVQTAPAGGTLPSFRYAAAPVVPREALGIGQRATVLKGQGITVAVLDTGFTASIDVLGELAGRTDPPMNALKPFRALPASDPESSFNPLAAGDFWEGHGTQVAILAAGARHGVAPQARVLPIKVCDVSEQGRASCRTTDVLRGLCFALRQVPPGQLVINLSLGGPVPVNGVHAVLSWAAAQGAAIVAAGGNQGLNGSPAEFPAAFAQPGGTMQGIPMFAVGSVTPAAGIWGRSGFSTRGAYLNISAPGEALDIGHPFLYSGTSFAAPLVAGAAALVKSAARNVPPAAVKAFMLAPDRTLQITGVEPMLRLSGY